MVVLLLQATAVRAESAHHLFTNEVSVVQGCQRAIERLKLEAIAAQCGAQLSGGSLRVQGEQQDRLERLYFESTAGYLSRYREQQREVEMVEPLPGESLFRCTVEAEVAVRCVQGERDPQFAPLFEQQVKLNRIQFEPEQEMVLSIEPSDALFVTILQLIPYLQESQRVWRLYPNGGEQSVLHGGKPVILPDPRYQWIVQLPQDQERVTEELVVIATRDRVTFPEKMSVEQFHRLLGEIPLGQRRELFIPYQIVQEMDGGVLK